MTSRATADVLLEIAKAVADGSSVDWNSAESSIDADPAIQDTVSQLKVLARLAEACRTTLDLAETQSPEPPLAVAPEQPLTSWGRLEIRRVLGQGRYGTVYLAWDPALEREIALKVMHDRERTAAILQEARLLARVRHPNVVTVYGVDTYGDAVGLRMELINGLTLKQTLSTRGMFGAQEAIATGLDLCRAVAAVHQAGLLHRDIKTHNVMRETGGRIVLMDFGAGEVRLPHMTKRLRAGTPLYLAPEVFDGQPSTIASDIYSLGVLLFHLVTLDYPVPGDTVDALIEAHAKGSKRALADVRPDLPTAFVRVVERALARDPAQRYRSAGAMQQDLASALSVEGATGASDAIGRGLARPRVAPSIAVLPFVSLGPDQEIEWLCEGLVEELLIALGKLPGLRVASRAATRSLQATTDIRALCRELNVTAVLEGTLRKSGDRVRISAQLVNAEDGCHIWSEGYNGDLSDVLGVQEGIAQNVVDKLQVTLAEVNASRLTRRHTDNPLAYRLYMKGRFYWARRYQVGLQTALDFFQKAIEEDAGYALAYAGVADAYTLIGFYSLLMPPRDAFTKAAEATRRAFEIDPELPEAHASLALVTLGKDWDFPAAERELRRALELDPTQVLSRIYLSWVLILRGDSATGILEARRAQEMEPLSPLVNAGVGFALYMSRRYQEAIDECEKSLEVDPNFLLAIHFTAMCCAQLGRLDDAIRLSERTVAMSDRAPFYLGLLGHYCARAGLRDRVDALLEELADLSTRKDPSKRKYVPPHCMVYIYAGLNDLDRAFEWQAKVPADGAAPFNFFSPVIDNVQSDPRQAADLQRMGIKR
jgi:eukaryotic-like serine/threonine-protein kinase